MTLTATTPATEPESDIEPELVTGTDTLTLKDRCDKCSAAAFVHVFLKNDVGELMFCSHHYQMVETDLFQHLSKICDERHKLVQNRLKGTEIS